MPLQPETIESKIMREIESGRVKLRSRYLFVAEKLGLGSAIALTIVLTVFIFSLLLFYLKATDSLIYLSFGRVGVYAFLESFPYALVIAVILLILAGGMLLRKSEVSYKKPFRYFALGMVIFVVATGSALAYTNVADVMEEQAYRHMPSPLFKHFFGAHDNQWGITGRIIGRGDDYIEVQAPCGLLRLDTGLVDSESMKACLVGRLVIAVGERQEDRFVVYSLQVIEENAVPLTGRHIIRRFAGTPGLPPVSMATGERCK